MTASFGPMPETVISFKKSERSFDVIKPKSWRVSSRDIGVNSEGNFGIYVAKLVEGRKRNDSFIADTVDIDDDRICVFFYEFAGKESDHINFYSIIRK